MASIGCLVELIYITEFISGAGVIDFESWRPIFRQQFGTLTPYIDLSMNIEKRRHWWWPTAWQKMEVRIELFY